MSSGINLKQQPLSLQKAVGGHVQSNLVSRTFFSDGDVRTLKESDFFDNSVRLKYDDCI